MSAGPVRCVGLRLAGASPRAPLVYADPGDLAPRPGDWVVVAQDTSERLARVVVAADQVVESSLSTPLPRLVRAARADERPVASRETAGAALARTLDVAPAFYERTFLAGPTPPHQDRADE